MTEEQVRTIVREELAAQEARRNHAEASGWAVEYIQRAIQAGIPGRRGRRQGWADHRQSQGPAIRQEMAAMGVAILEAVKKLYVYLFGRQTGEARLCLPGLLLLSLRMICIAPLICH